MGLAPIVGLEIGTSKVVALVGEMRDKGHVVITGMGEHPSTGVRKGEVIDLESAAVCVRAALGEAEESAKVSIGEVHLALSGGHIQGQCNSGTIPVGGKDGTITRHDVDQVTEVAGALNLPPNRVIMHTLYQHFFIDNHEMVLNPEGIEGGTLSLNVLVVHGIRSYIDNIHNVVKEISHIDVVDSAFSGLCAAFAVLTPEQRRSGALVIDLGGGTTNYVACVDNAVAAAGALGLGGDHVTNDIVQGFNIPPSQAERLKKEAGSAVLDPAVSSQRVSLPPEGGFPGRNVAIRSLHTVMNARVDEILKMVKKRLDDEAIMHHIGAGVILTGGGAYMNGIEKLTERIFGAPCIVGSPRNVSGQDRVMQGPQYAACCGLVQYGFQKMMEERSSSKVKTILKKILGG